ncbi:MAG: hypothetical protein OXN89_14360 [Bryobacterales bacterium]|nr:hypothetical protein [Bryobacterales bacterium]
MGRLQGTVLVDTNVILEAYRTGSWRALTGGYHVETVEDCVAETQTGYQLRRREQQIDQVELRGRLEAVHGVDDLARAGLAVRIGNLVLDEGEASLWAHALTRDDDWVLCGPDRPVCVVALDLGFARGSCRWSGFSMMRGIGQDFRFARRIPGSGTTERSESWFLSRMKGFREVSGAR